MIEAYKNLVNSLSVPEISLTFFFVPLFAMMLMFYKLWTRPIFAGALALIFLVFYFGSVVIDENYAKILSKPDNVPITLMLIFTGLCLWVAFRQAAINDQAIAEGKPLPDSSKDDKVLVWPDLVYTELICIVIATALLVLWSIVLRAPLEAPANQAGPPNPSKAPWYFLGLQEMLVYYDPWMAGVVLPGMIVSGLIMMPYVDTNPKGNGYYTFSERKFAITIWLFGFLILWVVLIVFGTFLRGPNWNFFGPYEPWNAHTQVPLTNVQFADYFWNGGNLMPFGLTIGKPTNLFVRELPGMIFVGIFVLGLPVIFAKTLFRKMYTELGFLRYWFVMIHFMVFMMLPLKMILRWTLTLKYFVNMPEFNLNL
ncbi:MAG: hypothetical protein WD768_13210 [Phycisphaeraceae bacterium]